MSLCQNNGKSKINNQKLDLTFKNYLSSYFTSSNFYQLNWGPQIINTFFLLFSQIQIFQTRKWAIYDEEACFICILVFNSNYYK
jgi:hypothetical protein